MSYPSIRLSALGWALAFVLAYLALDWASYVSPLLRLNITPWNPAPALGLLFVIRRGGRAAVALLAAIVASEVIVRGVPGGLAVTLWLALVQCAAYAALALFLARRFPDGGLFDSRSGLLSWSAIIVVGSLANSLLFISQLRLCGLLPPGGWADAALRFWIGDVVGIFVTMPLLWSLQDATHRRAFTTRLAHGETLAYSLLAAVLLWIALIPGAQAGFRYFYVLFLPVVWAASRHGLAGAIYCVSALQLATLVGGLLNDSPDATLFELQMRALLLALIGFLIGTTVDEQRRTAAELQQSLRLAAAGEMAGALAHELNQPLTALSAYASAGRQLLDRGAEPAQFGEVIAKLLGEADRAAGVVKRLRDLFRTGTTQREPVALAELVATASATFAEQARVSGVEFTVGQIPRLTIQADRGQLEIVLRNLLANAFDAVAGLPGHTLRTVRVDAHLAGAGRLHIVVTDNGPGLPAALAAKVFEPFRSTKSSGLGLGLPISRAIAEAHGGMLRADLDGRGRFTLELPIEASTQRRTSNHG